MIEELQFPAVMGILNVTPDSFSDGGKYQAIDKAMLHAERMIVEGADIIDVGGESTRPGAAAVSSAEETDRVLPVIERLRADFDIPVSVDTSTPEVMRASAKAGADLINDVRALRRDGALEAAAKTGLPVCLVHMQGNPETMQMNPVYEDLIAEIISFFEERIAACLQTGIKPSQIILDPGFGFGKTAQHNLQLISRLKGFAELKKPLLVGLSRKSTIGKILSSAPDGNSQLIAGSVAGAVVAVNRGASIVRVHDVAETVAALAVNQAILSEGVNLR